MQAPEAAPVTDGRRKELLAQAVAVKVGQGQRVEAQGEYQAIVVKGHRCNHLLHLILSLLTLGLWLIFVWLPLWAFGGERRTIIQVDAYGNVNETRAVAA